MSSDFQELDDWLKALLLRLTPAQVRVVNRRVAYELRRSQRERIARQQNPDGSAYKPRAAVKNLRGKAGAIKRRSMFAKLRTQSHLKLKSAADGFTVGFSGRSATIARTHQDGLARTSSSGRRFITPKRELLGLADSEMETLIDAYLKHLSSEH